MNNRHLRPHTIDFYFCFFFFSVVLQSFSSAILLEPNRKWRRSSSKSTRINNYFLVARLRLLFSFTYSMFDRFERLLYWHFGYYNSYFERIECAFSVRIHLYYSKYEYIYNDEMRREVRERANHLYVCSEIVHFVFIIGISNRFIFCVYISRWRQHGHSH